MKNLMVAIVLVISAIEVSAQQTDNPALKDYRRIVFFSGNDSVTAYITPYVGFEKADGVNLAAPWELQEDIIAIPETVIPEITTKVKSKYFEKYKVKDYDGFVLGEDVYHSLNVKTTISIGDSWMFLKLLSTGKINLYAQYGESAAITSPNGEGLTDYYTKLASTYSHVFKNANNPKKTGRLVEELSAKRDLADCPTVYNRYKNKEFEPEDGTGKIMGMYPTPIMININLRAIEAYNASCE